MSDMKQGLEEWEYYQQLKMRERRWVENICEDYIAKTQALDERVVLCEMFSYVIKALKKYPDDKFYMKDEEIESVCLSFMEDDVIKARMSRVD